MKKFKILFTVLVFSFALNAQIIPKKPKEVKHDLIDQLTDFDQIHKFSPFSKTLILKLLNEKYFSQNNPKVSKEIINLYQLILIGEEYYTGCLIEVNEKVDKNKLIKLGVKIGVTSGNIWSIKAPLKNILKIQEMEGIDYLDFDKPAKKLLDNAREYTGVDLVHQGYQLPQPFKGEGVIVGVVDIGFDFTHPVFWDLEYNDYRIQKVWDMGYNGNPPSGYGYGHEIVGAANIQNWMYDVSNVSHGTHVTGIAGGGYSGQDELYKGMAPESNLIIVANPPSGESTFSDGITYIFYQAALQNKPSVINLSWGSHIGPHDGTSLFDQFCDNIVGNGKILVGAAGNEGSDIIHLKKSFTYSDTLIYSFINFPYTSLGTNGATFIDLWGSQNSNFWISVNIFNINSNEFEDWTPYIPASSNGTYSYTLYDDDPVFPDECLVEITATGNSPLNNKPEILIWVDNTDQDDNYRYVLLEVVGYGTTIHAWTAAGDKAYFKDLGYNYPVIEGNTNYTVGELGGTGNAIISVGAYTTKNSYYDFNGNYHTIPFYTPLGKIAPFSSKGPTVDNRVKPDIAAPGNVIVSAVNSFDNNYTSNSPEVVFELTNGTDDWWYATMEGTSMASPVVTGIVALMLEANPELNKTEIVQLINNNAITDNYTGNVPNYTWGWGKIYAHDIMKDLVNTSINNQKFDNPVQNFIVSPNPTYGYFYINSLKHKGLLKVNINDLNGKLLINNEYPISPEVNQEININNLPDGLYIIHLIFDEKSEYYKIIKK